MRRGYLWKRESSPWEKWDEVSMGLMWHGEWPMIWLGLVSDVDSFHQRRNDWLVCWLKYAYMSYKKTDTHEYCCCSTTSIHFLWLFLVLGTSSAQSSFFPRQPQNKTQTMKPDGWFPIQQYCYYCYYCRCTCTKQRRQYALAWGASPRLYIVYIQRWDCSWAFIVCANNSLQTIYRRHQQIILKINTRPNEHTTASREIGKGGATFVLARAVVHTLTYWLDCCIHSKAFETAAGRKSNSTPVHAVLSISVCVRLSLSLSLFLPPPLSLPSNGRRAQYTFEPTLLIFLKL